MTSSDITNFDQKNQSDISYKLESFVSASGREKLLTLKLIEYLLLAVVFGSGMIIFFGQNNQNLVVAGAIGLIIATFLFLINRQAVQEYSNNTNQSDILRKAELYNYLSANNNSGDRNSVTPARAKALQYCQTLIEDYKRTRTLARNLYYILQIATVILSGVTPILVLVDKLETGQAWLKWLPVICPAIASIVASIVTSFPFQKNWIAANTAVELLEAEQEKFILGITQPYRCYDASDFSQQQLQASQAIEYFIVQVNNIHLQQLQQSNEPQQSEKTEATASKE